MKHVVVLPAPVYMEHVEQVVLPGRRVNKHVRTAVDADPSVIGPLAGRVHDLRETLRNQPVQASGAAPLPHFIHHDRIVRHGIGEKTGEPVIEGVRLFRVPDIGQQRVVVREQQDVQLVEMPVRLVVSVKERNGRPVRFVAALQIGHAVRRKMERLQTDLRTFAVLNYRMLRLYRFAEQVLPDPRLRLQDPRQAGVVHVRKRELADGRLPCAAVCEHVPGISGGRGELPRDANVERPGHQFPVPRMFEQVHTRIHHLRSQFRQVVHPDSIV